MKRKPSTSFDCYDIFVDGTFIVRRAFYDKIFNKGTNKFNRYELTFEEELDRALEEYNGKSLSTSIRTFVENPTIVKGVVMPHPDDVRGIMKLEAVQLHIST